MTRKPAANDATAIAHPHDVIARVLARGKTAPMLTGLGVIDDTIGEWLVPGGMVTIVGSPGSAKSAVLVCMTCALLMRGCRVVANVRDRRPEDFLVRLSGARGGPADRHDAAAAATYVSSVLPGFQLLDGTIEESLVELANVGPRVLMVDNLQMAETTGKVRGDSEGAHVDAVLRAIREARATGALVVATSEQTRGASGVGRHSAGIEGHADALLAMTQDGTARRWHLQVRKPNDGVARWIELDSTGGLVDVTTSSGAPAQARRAPAARRRADNPPALTAEQLDVSVRAYVIEHPGCTGRDVRMHVSGAVGRKLDALRRVARQGEKGGWHVD